APAHLAPGDPAAAHGPVPGDGGGPPPGTAPPRRSRRASRIPRPVRLGATLLVLVLLIVVGWGAGLLLWSNSRIEHVDALSGAGSRSPTTAPRVPAPTRSCCCTRPRAGTATWSPCRGTPSWTSPGTAGTSSTPPTPSAGRRCWWRPSRTSRG